jgi:energy-coupling factor transporter transmembrane protein EcfT
MNDLERWLKRLQGADHKTKKIIMWIGTTVIMVVIIFIWLNYSFFGYIATPDQSNKTSAESGPSNFEIFKNGLMVTLHDIQSLIQSAKEKITQTNSFDIEGAENSAIITATTTMATTTFNIYQNSTTTATTTNN